MRNRTKSFLQSRGGQPQNRTRDSISLSWSIKSYLPNNSTSLWVQNYLAIKQQNRHHKILLLSEENRIELNGNTHLRIHVNLHIHCCFYYCVSCWCYWVLRLLVLFSDTYHTLNLFYGSLSKHDHSFTISSVRPTLIMSFCFVVLRCDRNIQRFTSKCDVDCTWMQIPQCTNTSPTIDCNLSVLINF